jgi:hypothetical protein
VGLCPGTVASGHAECACEDVPGGDARTFPKVARKPRRAVQLWGWKRGWRRTRRSRKGTSRQNLRGALEECRNPPQSVQKVPQNFPGIETSVSRLPCTTPNRSGAVPVAAVGHFTGWPVSMEQLDNFCPLFTPFFSEFAHDFCEPHQHMWSNVGKGRTVAHAPASMHYAQVLQAHGARQKPRTRNRAPEQCWAFSA